MILDDVSFCHLVVVTDMDRADGTPVEFVELPGGVRSTYEMHRGITLRMGPAR